MPAIIRADLYIDRPAAPSHTTNMVQGLPCPTHKKRPIHKLIWPRPHKNSAQHRLTTPATRNPHHSTSTRTRTSTAKCAFLAATAQNLSHGIKICYLLSTQTDLGQKLSDLPDKKQSAYPRFYSQHGKARLLFVKCITLFTPAAANRQLGMALAYT